MRTITLFAFLTTALLLSVTTRGEDKWRKIENSAFSFSVPESFKKTDLHGIDSFCEEYVADGIKLGFDYGSYNPGDGPKGTNFEDLKIDGKAARVVTKPVESQKGFSFFTQVHFKLDGGGTLEMFAFCKSEKEVALARKIFQTIVFKTK